MEEKEKQKTQTSKVLIIVGVILAVIIIAAAAGIGSYFGAKGNSGNNNNSTNTWNNNKTTKAYEQWHDLYLAALINDSKNNLYADSSDVKIEFVQLYENMNPVMIVSYKKNNYTRLNVYSIHDQNGVKRAEASTTFPNKYLSASYDANVSYDYQLLYNVNVRSYRWYVHNTYSGTREFYEDLLKTVGTYNASAYLPSSSDAKVAYSFTEYQMRTGQVNSNGVPVISNFEKTFIVPTGIQDTSVKVGELNNASEETIIKHINQATDNYKPITDLVTDAVRDNVSSQFKTLQSRKSRAAISYYNNTNTKQNQTNTNTTTKPATTTTTDVLKVGSKTVKYGTYTGFQKEYDSTGVKTSKVTLKLRKNRTYSYYVQGGGSEHGTYSISGSNIVTNKGLPFNVKYNNVLEYQVGAGITLTYSGQ